MSEQINIFEKATRSRLRIQSSQGTIGVEDLWGQPLNKLNEIAGGLHKTLNDTFKDFLSEETVAETNEQTQLGFDIVIHIIGVKKEERDAKIKSNENAELRKRLLDETERRKGEAITKMSDEDIAKALKAAK